MKKLVAAMTEQAVAEALNNQDEDRRDLEKNFKRIEKELANQKKETLEWKAKYTTLQNDVQKAQKALGKTQK
jgi:dsDNA-specific endonuclease/ATPase MutS2